MRRSNLAPAVSQRGKATVGFIITGLVARHLRPNELREFRRTIRQAQREDRSTAASALLQEIGAKNNRVATGPKTPNLKGIPRALIGSGC